MEGRVQRRPRVSRETRLLLVTVGLAAVALWVLDRVRSFDAVAPGVAESAQPLLRPLLGRPAIDELSIDLARLDARIRPWVTTVMLPGGGMPPRTAAAVRLRDTLAIAFIPDGGEVPDSRTSLVAHDRPTGLTVFRVGDGSAAPSPAQGLAVSTAELSSAPRYLLSVDAYSGTVSVRPQLLSGLTVRPSPAWRGTVWALPPGSGATPGSLLFTTAAELAGAVVDDGKVLSLVPAPMLVAEVDRLMSRAGASPGTLPVEVENLSPAVGTLVGVEWGVVITWTNPADDSEILQSGDVVQAVNGEPVRSVEEWWARVHRLYAGDEVRLSVARGGDLRDVRVTASPAQRVAAADAESTASQAGAGLGLAMRPVPGLGTAVVSVAAGSRAAAAGLAPDDLISRAGDVQAPSPAQLRQAFAQGPVLLSVTRGSRHHVLVLQP
jgi:hypothetical protein